MNYPSSSSSDQSYLCLPQLSLSLIPIFLFPAFTLLHVALGEPEDCTQREKLFFLDINIQAFPRPLLLKRGGRTWTHNIRQEGLSLSARKHSAPDASSPAPIGSAGQETTQQLVSFPPLERWEGGSDPALLAVGCSGVWRQGGMEGGGEKKGKFMMWGCGGVDVEGFSRFCHWFAAWSPRPLLCLYFPHLVLLLKNQGKLSPR